MTQELFKTDERRDKAFSARFSNPERWRSALAEACHRRIGLARINGVLPNGKLVRGAGVPVATLRFHDWGAVGAFLMRDQLGLYECYLDQRCDFIAEHEDEAESLLAALASFDDQSKDVRVVTAALSSSRYFWQQNTGARRSALSVHYSVPPRFWLAFLTNEYPIYSHYLFEENETWKDWEVACERKLQFAMKVCRMKPGDRVLNVGEGWGGWLTYAGRRGMRVTGITLNDESYEACLTKRERAGLTDTCEVIKTDFYNLAPQDQAFDAITNMGVTEHLTDYDALMTKYAALLKSGGYVYSDFVGNTRDSPFRSLIQKLIYPGASPVYPPKLIEAADRSRLMEVVEIHDDRLSYDKTCEAWARTVELNQDFIKREFGEKRYRWIWSYLWMSVYGFRNFDNGITGTRVVLRRR